MSFRLLNAFSGILTEYLITASPPYLAASHAWSEQLFPQGVDFLASPGRAAILVTLEQRYPSIEFCWVDTICIDQNDDDDKLRQIPLMGKIFGNAQAVLIILGCELGMGQDEIDSLTQLLEGSICMEAEEAWATEGQYWQSGEGRALITRAMIGLARLTTTSWSTRVWTLQEYILARRVVWIGTDLTSLTVDDILFSALPNICDTLIIDECIGDKFDKLYSFFSGMANSRIRRIDRTRVMELLGNRKATVECDEVYGVMAASGVEISTIKGEEKEQAWRRWVEEALSKGHLRWLLMPVARDPSMERLPVIPRNCIIPSFGLRHKVSSGSALDKVSPLGPVSVRDGTAMVTGRLIGSCQIGARLGTVHEPTPNRIHRDITLILFTTGRWKMALRVASAYGAGRYNSRQVLLISQALITNWPRALRAVSNGTENNFKMKLRSERQRVVWQDFMAFQMGQMPGMNEGVAHLVTIRRSSVILNAVIVLPPGQLKPAAELVVIDVGGRTIDDRCVFLIAARGTMKGTNGPDMAMHKVAVTLPLTNDYGDFIECLPLETFAIGGRQCPTCREPQGPSLPSDGSLTASTVTVSAKTTPRMPVSLIKRRILKNRRFNHNRLHASRSASYRRMRRLCGRVGT